MENQAPSRRYARHPSQSVADASAPNEPRAVDQDESFRFIAASDLPVLPIDWLVCDYLEQNTLAVLYGRQDKDKTLLALDLSCCVATNTPYHGQAVREGAVFYLTGEDLLGIARRLRDWSAHNDISLQDSLLFISSYTADFAPTTHITHVVRDISARF